MKLSYPARFHPQENGYWVEFPGLDGCCSQGATVEEAEQNAAEALSGYLCSLSSRSLPIPKPMDARAISANSGFVSVVAADCSIDT